MLNNRITLRVIVYRFFFHVPASKSLQHKKKGNLFFFLIRSCYTLTLPFFFPSPGKENLLGTLPPHFGPPYIFSHLFGSGAVSPSTCFTAMSYIA